MDILQGQRGILIPSGRPNVASLVAFPSAVTKCLRLHFGLWFKGAVHLGEGHHSRNMRQLLHCIQVRKQGEGDAGAQQPTFLMGLPISVKLLRDLLQYIPTGTSSRWFSVQWCWQSCLTTTLGKASWDSPGRWSTKEWSLSPVPGAEPPNFEIPHVRNNRQQTSSRAHLCLCRRFRWGPLDSFW